MKVNKPVFGAESFVAGEIIFRQGDLPDKFYIITNGRVNIIYRNSNGRDVLINKLSAGDYFGEIGMARNTLRVATVQAEADVSVMVMDHVTFPGWLNQSILNRDEIDQLIEKRSANLPSPTVYEPPSRFPVTQNMDTTELKQQLTRSRDGSVLRTYVVGDIIMKQGDAAENFYILVEGEVEVLNSDGMQVDVLKSGSYFGEMGLIEGDLRSATIRTLTPVQVIMFDKTMFGAWMEKSPISQSNILKTVEERIQHRHEYSN